MKHRSTFIIAVASSCLMAACGGPPPAEPPTAEPMPGSSDEGQAEATSPTVTTWEAMSRDQKIEHMKEEVMPKMSELFASFDAEEFDKVTCGTCHGSSAKEGNFEMPNPELPKLTMPSGEGEPFAQEKAEHPEMATFMMTKVTPTMVELLPGMKAYDPATQSGFGCFGCHTPK